MIDLYSANTPNGKKIGIMLEEIGFKYKVIKVDIKNGEQFKEKFKKISPFSKIPVIIDNKNQKTVFESGAILIYLAELSGKFYNSEERYFKISKRIYKELDERLSKSNYLSGDNYTIADIGTFPWIARHEWHDIGLKNYKNLTRWYEEISNRDGVKKGFAFMDENEVPPNPY